MNNKILITLFLLVFFSIIFYPNSINLVDSQESDKIRSLSKNFSEVINSKIGIEIKYPADWSVQYIKGNNNSLVISPLSFQDTVSQFKEYYNKYHLLVNDSFVYQMAQEAISQIKYDCGIFYCPHIEDEFLQSYVRDIVHLRGYQSIFDYVPTLIFSAPLDNLTDNYLENVKIASFENPDDTTLDDFIEYLYPSDNAASAQVVSYHCQSNLTSYPACELIYTFEIGHELEKVKYVTLQLFIEENKNVYLISYNALEDTFLRHIGLVEEMLESFKLTK